jgi:hypothetical protein
VIELKARRKTSAMTVGLAAAPARPTRYPRPAGSRASRYVNQRSLQSFAVGCRCAAAGRSRYRHSSGRKDLTDQFRAARSGTS